MRRYYLIVIIFLSLTSQIFPQDRPSQNFWRHHSLDLEINSLHRNVSGTFYASSDSSILISNDYGISWDVIYTTPHPCEFWTRLDIFTNKNYFPQDKLVVRQFNGSTACIDVPPKISSDGGINWTDFNTPPGYLKDMAINSFGNIYVASDSNLYVTTDDGNNWQIVNIPAEDEEILKVEIDSLNNIYISKFGLLQIPPYTLTYENIYRSTNFGQDWNLILSTAPGLAYGYTYLFSIPKGDLFASWDLNTQHYFNGITKYYPLSMVSSAHITIQGNIYLTEPGEGILVSIDDGLTWKTENSGLISLRTTSIVSDSIGYLYTSTEAGIFKSNFTSYHIFNDSTVIMDDTRIADTSYKNINVFNPFTFELNVDSITIAPYEFFIPDQSIQTIFPQDSVSLQVGFSPSGFGEVEGDIIFHCGIIKAKIDVVGNSPRPFLISEKSLQFGLLNIGDSKVDTLFATSESINSLYVDIAYLKRNLVFDIEDLSLPQVLEQGDTLKIPIRFFPDTVGMLIDTLNIISNAINNIHEVRLTGYGQNPNSIENNQNVITEFIISQNFPNPFNPTTKIKYFVPHLSKVTIKVYDVLVNEIEMLVNEEKSAGRYEVIFNASRLPSGIYFYRLQAGSFVETKKMVLIK